MGYQANGPSSDDDHLRQCQKSKPMTGSGNGSGPYGSFVANDDGDNLNNGRPANGNSKSKPNGNHTEPLSKGRTASDWGFLLGCFWLEALIWGSPYSYGIFQQHYSSLALFSHQKGIAAVGTTCMGVAYFGGPIVFAILQQWPSRMRSISAIGLLMMTVSLVIASFSTHVVHLILTQGLLYGAGGALLYNPFLIYVEERFEKDKGLAYSIFWAGTGFSGAVVPFVMDWALDRYGFRNTLRIWAVFIFVSLALLVFLMSPSHLSEARTSPKKTDFSFLWSGLFWAFQIGNILEGLGYFMPQIYLFSFAKTIGASDFAGILSVSLLNLFSTIGLVLTGIVVDKYHISTVLLMSAATSAFCVLVFWGLAVNEALLYVFSITFGTFAGGYVATWTGCALEIQRAIPGSDVAYINGWMAVGRGFGCIFGGPISEALLSLGTMKAKGAYGTKYGIVIIFTGVSSLMGRFGLFGRCGLKAGDDERGEDQARQPLIR